MLLSIPKEIEDLITRCQRIVNNRFWFCPSFEFRYGFINPSDDTSSVRFFVGVGLNFLIIDFKLATVCSDVDGCEKTFIDALNGAENYLVYSIMPKEGENNGF